MIFKFTMIQSRLGKKKGKIGVTIHIYNQYTKPQYSKTLTLGGDITVEQAYELVRFFFSTLDKYKGKITIEGE